MASSWKRKGSPLECANSRCLLVADHIGKAFAGCVKEPLQPIVDANMADTQYGCTAGGGTDYPNHTVRSLLQYAKLLSLSVFILFLSLETAFDRVIREIVMGWPQHLDGALVSEEEQIEYLVSIGMQRDAAAYITQRIREDGTALEAWGADPKVVALIRGLHTKAWFKVGDNDSYVATYTGGRQGCKLGATIFNSVYEQALVAVRSRLHEAGIVLVLKVDDEKPFWSSDDGSWCTVDAPVVEVTYVDDEAAVLVAIPPAALDVAIEAMLPAYVDLFRKLLPCNVHTLTMSVAALRKCWPIYAHVASHCRRAPLRRDCHRNRFLSASEDWSAKHRFIGVSTGARVLPVRCQTQACCLACSFASKCV